MEVNVVTLEDGKDYIVIDTVVCNEENYLFLANENEEFDVTIRKIIVKDGKEYLVKLDSDEEFEEVMTSFNEKHKGNGEINEE